MHKGLIAMSLSGLLLSLPAAAQAQTAPAACQFILGFKALHDANPSQVGDCTDDQTFVPNGDAQQHTTKGLLAWRKSDNFTAFTNGFTTWVNGPAGVVSRLNSQRYPWESDYNAPGVTKLPAAAPAAALQPNGQAWTVAFDHNLLLPSITVDDGKGNVSQMPPKGKWVNVYFNVRNNGARVASLSSANIKLGDAQGRSYESIFDLRRIQADGQEVLFDGNVQPGETALLRLTFDVAKDATGGVLVVPGGNLVAVL
jgi:hypothetical protein